MEQSVLDSTTEHLCGICTNRFRGDVFIKHLTEHIGIPDKKHAHFLWCQLCSPLLRNSDAYEYRVEYSDEMDIARNNCINVNPQYGIDTYTLSDQQKIFTVVNYGTTNFYPYFLDANLYPMHQNHYSENPASYSSDSCSVTAYYGSYVHAGTTYFSYIRDTPNVSGENFQSQEEVTAENQHPDDTCVDPSQKSTCTEKLCVEDATIVETQEATKDDTQQINATYSDPCPEATNAEVRNTDVKTRPDTKKTETILENDTSEVANALNESRISQFSNAKPQPYTSNSNRKRNSKYASRVVSFNINIRDGYNSSGRNSCEQGGSQDCKNVNNYVVNRSRGRNWDNSSGNANSRRSNWRSKNGNISGNANNDRVSGSGIHFKNYSSRADCPSSSDFDPQKKRRYDQNGNNNGLKNGNSMQSSPNSDDNSNSVNSQTGVLSCNGSNAAFNTHSDNQSDRRQGEGKFSDASSEVSKSNSSYSEAVKRRPKSIR